MKIPHQHFIPQSYLRKFAHTKNKDVYLVSAYDKLEKKIIQNISVYAICAETDLYTLKHLEGNLKYTIENFFSNKIENKYPSVYNLLVIEKKKIISLSERADILYTILSMYFRTPKVLNKFASFSAELLEKVKSQSNIDTIEFLGIKISLQSQSFNEIKKEIKETNRVNFLKTQLELLDQFIKFKSSDGLVVVELDGDQEFITSDNPVDIGNESRVEFNLFDYRNSIYVPLDPKHALYISPSMKGSIINEIFYQRDNFIQHITLNHSVYRNSERWIIGTNVGIEKFMTDNEEYSKPSDNSHPIMIEMNTKLKLMTNILSLMEKDLSNNNEELIKALKALKQHEIFNDHIDLMDLHEQLKKLGLNI